ncbi:2-amino-4-hydroxy-6-hydroxymethyldihydropteridine diphosphokinase [Aeromonas cavernicola]|uniref:2-amino-4-hydroxy-6-hydroxymethyldihydropteridine pyrophosphokinase n=1 Tax=Aeromonas cavernicola TaxID=1006623 RepID=A0A2H9U6B2_9GAMM|nr:2-amino-4-hydroxy-6-hydroxymethyldihydropteridine diphosphokinase [Aeromonas cavernicola]PJG59596.1 2-amino-4-hydroxy-6-hydroxymethyldihydropteridine diphosphokinase [Aeromonas cavernicola]
MFYLCSMGSNIEPHTHVSQALTELLTQFGRLHLSSVIQTTPVGMQSSHDFLNCLFIIETPLASPALKALFIAMELAHGRDRQAPDCKIRDRPLDIDILASSEEQDFSSATVDDYLNELLAELYGRTEIQSGKVSLPLHTQLTASKVIEEWQIGLAPLWLGMSSNDRQRPPTIDADAGPGHVVIGH